MKYVLEWQYSDAMEPEPRSGPYIHFVFMLRFPDVPTGKGHVAHFAFNVLRNPETNESGVTVVSRGFLACVPLSKPVIVNFVEVTVAQAFERGLGEDAISELNAIFIYEDADFSNEFTDDLLEQNELLALIEHAFDGVGRDDGITLHQAVVIDDHGTEDEFVAAGKLDTETRWQDVPDEDISTYPHIFCFLDPKGFRYYLPAAMSWAVKSDEHDEYERGFFTYLAVLPTVAPRDIGRGLGAAFDLSGFIEKHAFTPSQVNAIYRFICFMAIKADAWMDEDFYAATQKWRKASEPTPRPT